ncbi:hypothetical protein FEM48_Zijuj05G0054900 [Ziziphus jujuba var. spinosa]|uniref:Nucleoside diphosphate kinase n=1 Tax=Ziziphus jujuba var. spinosa TaxID=714518 RepID=A0A978VD33_ZIZJJ|nr:hypothetical protein FEM48_Zijuj05G0054900 [Ziziphus jujuba var. spinosa]
MEALAVFGGGSPCLSSSITRSSSERICSLSYTHNPTIRYSRHHHHLAAFPSTSHLFSYCLSRPHAKLRTKSRIFLPHLVAALVGEIISRFEKKGFKLTGLKLFQCPRELAEEHYKDLKAKSFFPKLIEYITSGPVVCMAWEGVGVVASARKLIGSTNPLQAEPGTIRGDLAVQTGRYTLDAWNVVHGSDSPENGNREIALWFKEGEIIQWTPTQEPWLIE